MLIVLYLLTGIVLGILFVIAARIKVQNEPFILAAGLLGAALVYLSSSLANSVNLNRLIIEAIGVAIYGGFALLGLRSSLTWLALGWAIHPAWDAGLHLLSQPQEFVPIWYSASCIGFDLIVAVSILQKANPVDWMNYSKRPQQILLAIVTLNLVSTWLHYTDNALFLNRYPGPDWFTPIGVLLTVIVMTPIGLAGYWLYSRRSFWLAYLLLGIYSITSLSSPGHYLFPMLKPMSPKMHGLIWLDAVSGLALIGFLLWSFAIAREWHRTEAAN